MKKQIMIIMSFAFMFLFSLSFVLGSTYDPVCGEAQPPESITVSFCNLGWAYQNDALNTLGGWGNGDAGYVWVDDVSSLESVTLNLEGCYDEIGCTWEAHVPIRIGYSNIKGKPENSDYHGIWGETADASIELTRSPGGVSSNGLRFEGGWSINGNIGPHNSVLGMTFFSGSYVDNPEEELSNKCEFPGFNNMLSVNRDIYNQRIGNLLGLYFIPLAGGISGGVSSEKAITVTSEFFGNSFKKGDKNYYYLGKEGEFKDSDGNSIGGKIGCKIRMPSCYGSGYINGDWLDLSQYSPSEIGLMNSERTKLYSQTDLSKKELEGYNFPYTKYELDEGKIYDAIDAAGGLGENIFEEDVKCYVTLKNSEGDERVVMSEPVRLIPRNIKDKNFFESVGKAAFVVSDDNWHDALQLIPAVTIEMGLNADIGKDLGQSTIIKKNAQAIVNTNNIGIQNFAYPLLVYNKNQFQKGESSDYVNWISKTLRPSRDVYGGVFAASTDFIGDFYKPEKIVFVGSKQPGVNNLHAPEMQIDNADTAWKTMGVKAVVPYDDVKAGVLATKLKIPIVFTDGSWESKIENKFVIYISTTDSDIDKANINKIKQKGFLLTYEFNMQNGPTFKVDLSDKVVSSFGVEEGSRSYKKVWDYIASTTWPQGLILVNPHDVEPGFCNTNEWHCRSSVLAAILSTSNNWAVDFVDEKDPWTDTFKEINTPNEYSIFTPEIKITQKEEQVKAKIVAIDKIFSPLVKAHYGINAKPNYIFLASPRDIPAMVIKESVDNTCGEPKLREIMNVNGPYGERLFSDNIYATSSLVSEILFPLSPDCPNADGKIVNTKDNPLPPYIQFVLGADDILFKVGSDTNGYLDIMKNRNQLFDDRVFKQPKDFEKFLTTSPITNIEGIPNNKLSCYLRQVISVAPPVYDPSRNTITISNSEQMFMISYYYSVVNKLRYGMLYAYENIVAIDALTFRNSCSNLPEVNEQVSKLFEKDIMVEINQLKASCPDNQVSAGSNPTQSVAFDDMTSDITKMLNYENDLLDKATDARNLANDYANKMIPYVVVDDASGEVYGNPIWPPDKGKLPLLGYPKSGGGELHYFFATKEQALKGANNADRIAEIETRYRIWDKLISQTRNLLTLRQNAIQIRETGYSVTKGTSFKQEIFGDNSFPSYGAQSELLNYPGSVKMDSDPKYIPIDKKVDTSKKVCPWTPLWDANTPHLTRNPSCSDSEKVPVVKNALVFQLFENAGSMIDYFNSAQEAIKCINTPYSGSWDDMYRHCAETSYFFGVYTTADLSRLLYEKSPPVMSFTDLVKANMKESGKEAPLDSKNNLDIAKLPSSKQKDAMRSTIVDSYFKYAEDIYKRDISETAITNSQKATLVGVVATALSLGLAPGMMAAGSVISIAGARINSIVALSFLADMAAVGSGYQYGMAECQGQLGVWDTNLGKTINPTKLKPNPGPTVVSNYQGCVASVNFWTGIGVAAAATQLLFIRAPPEMARTVKFLETGAQRGDVVANAINTIKAENAVAGTIGEAEYSAAMLQLRAKLNNPAGATAAELADIDAMLASAEAKATARAEANAAKLATVVKPPIKCFIAGTMITMSDRTQKPIEDIIVGDRVLSYDIDSGALINSSVEELILSNHSDMINITFSNGKSNVNTFDHPYWVVDKGWSSYNPERTSEIYGFENVEKLRVGDKVLSLDGTNNVVESKVIGITEDIGEVQTYIFNLKNENPNPQRIIEYEIIG